MKPCISCAYYLSTRSEAQPEEQGFCRRYPPSVHVNGDRLSGHYAPVRGDMGCGEHKPSVRVAARKAA